MQLHPPAFWRHKINIAYLLWPLSLLYRLAGKIYYLFTQHKQYSVPVICIGNITLGGSGKTPVTLAFAEEFKRLGVNVWIVSRGYGGKLRGPMQVDLQTHDATQVGDEPLLLAQTAPTIIAKCRRKAVDLAISKGAELVLMDDGLQNPYIQPAQRILVLDHALLGNQMLFPAGPLRETLAGALDRIDAVVLFSKNNLQLDVPILRATKIATIEPINEPVIAFAGIAFPDNFFATLKAAGWDVRKQIAFADHYNYHIDDLEQLLMIAKVQKARLITTTKDLVRMPRSYQEQILSLPVKIQWQDSALMQSYCRKIISRPNN